MSKNKLIKRAIFGAICSGVVLAAECSSPTGSDPLKTNENRNNMSWTVSATPPQNQNTIANAPAGNMSRQATETNTQTKYSNNNIAQQKYIVPQGSNVSWTPDYSRPPFGFASNNIIPIIHLMTECDTTKCDIVVLKYQNQSFSFYGANKPGAALLNNIDYLCKNPQERLKFIDTINIVNRLSYQTNAFKRLRNILEALQSESKPAESS